MEREVNASPKRNKDHLMATIEKNWNEIYEDTVRASCVAVPKRLAGIVKAKGGHIE